MVEEWDGEITFPANKYIKKKKLICIWNNFYRTCSEYWQKSSDFHKASRSSQNDIGQNIEIKI